MKKVLTYSQNYSARSAPLVDGNDGNHGIVEEFHGLQDLIPVSPQWRLLIEHEIGISLVLGNNEENREVADISRITEIGVASCKIMSSYIKSPHLRSPPFKSPHLLRTLEIYNGNLDYWDYQSLLAGVRNLHTLTLSSKTYRNFNNVSNLQLFELQNLRLLTLGNYLEENALPARWWDDRYMAEFGFWLRSIASSPHPHFPAWRNWLSLPAPRISVTQIA